MQAIRGKLSISFLVLVLVSLLSTGASYAVARGEKIGVIIGVSGSVGALRGGSNVALAVKDEVFLSDTLVTGADGKVQIILDDDSSLTFGPNTSCELSEFANEGKSSRFSANLGNGIMRVITGTITESNPGGFKISTPLATVGIRGTDLTVITDENSTEVYNNNSDNNLTVNGADVPQGNKAVVDEPGGTPVIGPITPEDKEQNLLLSTPPGGDNTFAGGQEGGGLGAGGGLGGAGGGGLDLLAAGLMTDITEHPMQIPVPEIPPVPIIATGTVSGGLGIPSLLTGNFGFSVNLGDGSIADGFMKGSGSLATFDYSGGKGVADATGFSIADFTGSGSFNDPYQGTQQTTGAEMYGDSTLERLGAIQDGGEVPIGFALLHDGIRIISGPGTGTITR
ncbi:hypothetical protein AGMMS49957_08120 [Synergistales bacterium]|nr:hypothetical protein AGMMS49957_08120 [Synergistales bacterium]